MAKLKIVYKDGRPVDLIDLENPQAVLEYAQQEGIPIMPSWSTAEQIVQAIDWLLNDKEVGVIEEPEPPKKLTKLEKRKADGLKNNPLRKFT